MSFYSASWLPSPELDHLGFWFDQHICSLSRVKGGALAVKLKMLFTYDGQCLSHSSCSCITRKGALHLL